MTTATEPIRQTRASFAAGHWSPASFAAISRLARKAPSSAAYYRDVTRLIAQAAGALYAVSHVRLRAEVVEESWCSELVPAGFWREPAAAFLGEAMADGGLLARLYRSSTHGLELASLAVPLGDGEQGQQGAIVVMLPCEVDDAGQRLAALHALAIFVTQASALIGPTAASATGGSGGLNKALQQVGNYETEQQLAFAVVNQLKTKSGCEQVALGRVHGCTVRVMTLSGLDDVKRRSPGVVLIQQAMEECLDHGETIFVQHESEWSDARTADFKLHRQWHESAGGDGVATLPLKVDGCCTYLLSLRRNRKTPFRQDELDRYREQVEPYASALGIVDRATRGLARHTAASVGGYLAGLFRPGGLRTKVWSVLGACLCLWFAFGTLPYRITVNTRVVPAESFRYCAPRDGKLLIANVAPGDRVEAGTLLVKLDDSELLIERSRLTSELRQARISAFDAQAAELLVEAQLHALREDELTARLAVVDLQLAETELRAPFDGEIIEGDLRMRRGDFVQKGEPLFHMSPSGHLRFDLRVPETEVSQFARGQGGQFAAFARPEARLQLEVVRLALGATQVEGANVYVVEALPADSPAWLRAGMEGVSHIGVGYRKVWWITLHRLLRFLELKMWM